jgi:hydroxymethylglutaryl-CoA synthase
MAVAAGSDCLKGIERDKVDSLFFATTTSPYKEKQASSLIATALDLDRHILTADFAHTLRSGTIALRLAMDAINAGTARNILIIAADCRLGAPGSEFEQSFGDGAAAILVGSTGLAATIEGSYTHYDERTDVWKTDSDRFVNSWEDRFVLSEGYSSNVEEAVTRLLKEHHLTPKDFAKAAIYAPDRRSHLGIARSLKFDAQTQAQDPMLDTIGNAGAASVLLTFLASLQEVKAGDRILLASYGNGADAFILQATDGVQRLRNGRGVKDYLAVKQMIPHYGRYLRIRQLIGQETARRRPAELSSPVVLWRDRRRVLALIGQKCRHCGKIQYPKQRVCVSCYTKDDFEPVRLADKKAKVFTFSLDNLGATVLPPLIKTVVDCEGGGRIACHMTDCASEEVKIGMTVEMTFRKMHEAMGYPNYWWKCKPVRLGE